MTESTGIPTRAIHEVHLETLSARQAVAAADNPTATGAHRELQRSVAAHFDALRPYLTAEDAGRDYYQGVIPSGPSDRGKAILDESIYTEKYSPAAFQRPPEDASLSERRQHLLDQVPVDDNEQAVDIEISEEGVTVVKVRYKAGLKHLETLYSSRQQVIHDRDDWMPDAEPRTEVQLELLDLDILMRSARALDEAAKELGFLPGTDERPKNTIDSQA